MILSYSDEIFGDGKRHRVKAVVTTDHPASSYGQPVIVLEDGGALDLTSWVFCQWRIERATKRELAMMQRIFDLWQLMLRIKVV